MQERELIQQIKNKDQQAFRILVDRYQVMIINTCIGFVHNRDEAEDIAQEVFIQAYLSANKFRGDSSLSTWLYRIAVNKSLNYIRDNQKRKTDLSISQVQDKNKDFDIIAGPESKSDYKLMEADRKQNLHSAIDTLAENQKTAFVLSKYEELSYKEIADIMKLSISSVESLLFRAKQNLQKRLLECYKRMNE